MVKFNEGGCRLGVMGFYAAPHKAEQCGANGLPLTPNSVKLFGQAQELKGISHPSLCAFIDVVLGEQERVYWVVEHHATSAIGLIADAQLPSGDIIFQIGSDILHGLSYLHARGIVSRNVSLTTILITDEGKAKLSSWGLYAASENGGCVGFPIGDALYMSPELIGRGPYSDAPSTPKEDVWALGVAQLQLLLGSRFWDHIHTLGAPHHNPLPILERVMEYHASELINSEQRMTYDNAARRLRLFAANPTADLDRLTQPHVELIASCLNPTAKCRPSARQLLSHRALPGNIPSNDISCYWPAVKSANLGSAISDLDLGELNLANRHDMRINSRTSENTTTASNKKNVSACIHADPLVAWDLRDVYYLWSLLDIGLENEFVRKGYVKKPPSIFRVPRMIRASSAEEVRPQTIDQSMIFNPATYLLDTSALSKRLQTADLDLFPVVASIDGDQSKPCEMPSKVLDSHSLPLLIRERDLDYQHYRIQVIRRLLRGFPYLGPKLQIEARTDIPRPLRAEVWAAILGVPSNIEEIYDSIDKEAVEEIDHQLAVDIPRCHQYDPLLSSPTGHVKFKRVLKAWINTNPKFVYWQGLDSLCAPFLVSSFTNEARAYGCLDLFVKRYLQNFFLKDNSMVMQEYLAIFVHMVNYHDPELGYHMHEIGFIPELFAIPWFLTCYAHVFPLDKIMHIWDSLMLCGASMVICIGVAIVIDIRDVLLSFNFEQCILLFSDAPDVDVERIIVEARSIFESTKPSMCARQFSGSKEGAGNYVVPAIPVLKSQICPCISITDFMEIVMLGEIDRSNTNNDYNTDNDTSNSDNNTTNNSIIDIMNTICSNQQRSHHQQRSHQQLSSSNVHANYVHANNEHQRLTPTTVTPICGVFPSFSFERKTFKKWLEFT
eukprot:m.80221 g.80221  ORF g.80221 m.80221 type:complete len:893 (+) comp25295_c1_seq1:150-2828(+)